MLKLLPQLVFIFIALHIIPSSSYARVTPEDIINSKKALYQQRVKNYSPENKQKLEDLSKKIAEVNKKRSQELDLIMQRQAQILDEYVRRNSLIEENGKDVENARYWLTYAHEAVAYQAAKIYIFELTYEANIKSNALNLISLLQIDLNSTRSKVIKSQNALRELIKE